MLSSNRQERSAALVWIERYAGTNQRAIDDFLVFGVSLLVYFITLAPVVTTGDSGELVTAAATWSLAHPTGYPLYLLTAHLFLSLLPFLSAAYALNLFSAILMAGSCCVLRRILEALTAQREAAVSMALFFAFSQSAWSQATTARVYALGALLIALPLLELLLLHMRRGGSLGRAYLWFGLGMANHTVSIVLVPLLLIETLRANMSWWERSKRACLALPGFLLYLYIPIVAATDPVQNWGDPQTPEKLLAYLSRESFWSKRFVRDAGDAWSVALHYLAQIPSEFTWLGAALLLFGIGVAARTHRWPFAIGLYLGLSNMALMLWHGSRQDIFYWNRYMITGWLGLSLIAGIGTARILTWFRSPSLRLGIAAALPLAVLLLHFPSSDRSHDTYAKDFAEEILEGLEPNSVLVAGEDNVVFPLSYLHFVEGIRPDVTLVMQGINRLSDLPVDPARVPTYFTHLYDLGAPALELIPDGLVFRLTKQGDTLRGQGWSDLPAFERFGDPRHKRYLDRSLAGNYLFMKAIHLEGHDDDALVATLHRNSAISFDNAINQVNVGLLFERNLHFEEAYDAFANAYRIDPLNGLAAQRVRMWEPLLAQLRDLSDNEARIRKLSSALFEIGKVELATKVLRQAARDHPGSEFVHYNLAALLIGQGTFEEAERELAMVLAIRPAHELAKRDLEQVRRALQSSRK